MRTTEKPARRTVPDDASTGVRLPSVGLVVGVALLASVLCLGVSILAAVAG